MPSAGEDKAQVCGSGSVVTVWSPFTSTATCGRHFHSFRSFPPSSYYSTAIMDLGTSSTGPVPSNVKYENEGETEMEEDVLADYFEKSASAVRHTFARCVSSWCRA